MQKTAYEMRISDWSSDVCSSDLVCKDGTNRGATPYGRHAHKNLGLSIVRADRELDLDDNWVNSYDPVERWWGVEVDFLADLDEIFGVTNNKKATTHLARMAAFDWEDEEEDGETLIERQTRHRRRTAWRERGGE